MQNYTPPSVEEILSTLPKWSKHEDQRTSFVAEQLKVSRPHSIGCCLPPLFTLWKLPPQKKDKGFQGDAKRKESKVVRPPGSTEYVVEGNETIAGIALKHNVPAPLLVKVNMLHTSAILPGQV